MSGVEPRPAIASMVRYKSANMSDKRAGAVIRLSANEGALGPSEKAMAAMSSCAGQVHRYPPVESSGLSD